MPGRGPPGSAVSTGADSSCGASGLCLSTQVTGSWFLTHPWTALPIRKFFLTLRQRDRGPAPPFLTSSSPQSPRSSPPHYLPLCSFPSHPNDDKDSGFFPRNTSSSSVNSVMGNHHPTPSHGPDGAVPTMADDLGEPAPLWPHDPDAKEVSRLSSALGWGTERVSSFQRGP